MQLLLFKGSQPPKSLATPAGFQNTNQTIDLRNNEQGWGNGSLVRCSLSKHEELSAIPRSHACTPHSQRRLTDQPLQPFHVLQARQETTSEKSCQSSCLLAYALEANSYQRFLWTIIVFCTNGLSILSSIPSCGVCVCVAVHVLGNKHNAWLLLENNSGILIPKSDLQGVGNSEEYFSMHIVSGFFR